MQSEITDLQMRLTYQEDDIKQLNQALTRQQRQLDELRRQFNDLQERLAALTPSPVGEAGEEPPPHY